MILIEWIVENSQESRGNLPAAEEERLRVEKQGTTR